MAESKIELQWIIGKIKVVLLTVYKRGHDEDLISECDRLYSEYGKVYNEVVIFFFRSGDLLDTFVELFLGHNKSEEKALNESGYYAKFIGSTLTFKEAIEDIELDILLNPISITQNIGIEDYRLKRFADTLDLNQKGDSDL